VDQSFLDRKEEVKGVPQRSSLDSLSNTQEEDSNRSRYRPERLLSDEIVYDKYLKRNDQQTHDTSERKPMMWSRSYSGSYFLSGPYLELDDWSTIRRSSFNM